MKISYLILRSFRALILKSVGLRGWNYDTFRSAARKQSLVLSSDLINIA